MTIFEVLFLAFMLIIITIFGFANLCRNVISILISLELFLLGVSLLFISFSIYLDDMIGQVYIIFILTNGASESAIGLASTVLYYRIVGSILLEHYSILKG